MTTIARYEVSHPTMGVVDHFARIQDARRYCSRRPLGYQIYDRMAHKGWPELWTWTGIIFQVERRRRGQRREGVRR